MVYLYGDLVRYSLFCIRHLEESSLALNVKFSELHIHFQCNEMLLHCDFEGVFF